ncbi:HNH endonuclease [Mycolicibacterium gilvum]|uniref:HNH nuclease n=1 Tax=Mycolicibacterium gilvum TaxID=1804 RepID=A0A378STC2_9MYCO|nr:HNH nuclease [Mycolicibacterium gilvum]
MRQRALVARERTYAHAVAVNNSRRARAARRRKRRVAAVVNDLTDAQWASIKAAWEGCAYCGKTTGTMQRDCVMAISRGGRYTVDNVVPACGACNASKCNDEVTGWLRRKRYDERLFLERYVRIRAELMSAERETALTVAPEAGSLP